MLDGEKINALNALRLNSGWNILMQEIDEVLESELENVVSNGMANLRDFDIWRARRKALLDLKNNPAELIASLSKAPEVTEEGLSNDPFPVASNPDIEV